MDYNPSKKIQYSDFVKSIIIMVLKGHVLHLIQKIPKRLF